jgi:hypothetical protein
LNCHEIDWEAGRRPRRTGRQITGTGSGGPEDERAVLVVVTNAGYV